MLKHFSEIVIQDILPAVRALVAKELTAKYKLTQQQAAEKLGVTQAAVSQYSRELRGWRVKLLSQDEKISAEVKALAGIVRQAGLNSQQALEQLSAICKLVRDKYFVTNPLKEIYPGLELCKPKAED